ncbi:hypothetical protein Q8F55_003855 [Vanrija albida]|uniref:Ricin B lectin domain-containing protein n=1 Tax=Vanrija albida TaxID=181172 RepID=A0ABR3Q552_9TREE
MFGIKVTTLALLAVLPQALAVAKKYTLSPAGFPDLCLAPAGDVNGAGLTVKNCDEDSVVFKYSTKSGKLRNTGNKLCIDVKDGVKKNGTPAQLWGCYTCNKNQVFDFHGTTANNTVQWTGSDYCLDLTDGEGCEGTPVQLWRCVPGNTNQLWTVTEVHEEQCEEPSDGAAEAYAAAAEEPEPAADPTPRRRHFKDARRH